MTANLAHVLEESARRAPEAQAVAFEGHVVTYTSLDAEAKAAATGLAALGVNAGDRVALWLPNHPAFAPVMYGAWRRGSVVVPLHAMLTAPEARHILTDAGAKVVLCTRAHLGIVAEAGVGHAIVVDGEGEGPAVTYQSLLSGSAAPSEAASVSAEDLALVAYTAGTSGVPKGAMLSHGNLRANLEQMRQTPISIRGDDVVLCILPLFHIFGLNVVLNLSVDVGAKVVLFERFDPVSTLDAIRSEGVTLIAGAPPAYVAWLGLADAPADAFASVRVAVSGAAPLPQQVLTGFRERFGVTIWEGYGLTETAPALTSTAVGGLPKPGSIGRPLPGVDLRLVDEDGADVEPGDPGEIVVRGPNVFSGYWGRPQESERVLVDGWFSTGDVAVADDDGDLFIVDRRHDLIIVSGFNVYPREVEDVLRRHPKVVDCAVVGDPDPRTGESVRAILVAAGGSERPDDEEIIVFCRASLAPYKVPATVEVVPEIPRNAAGKVLRRMLRQS